MRLDIGDLATYRPGTGASEGLHLTRGSAARLARETSKAKALLSVPSVVRRLGVPDSAVRAALRSDAELARADRLARFVHQAMRLNLIDLALEHPDSSSASASTRPCWTPCPGSPAPSSPTGCPSASACPRRPAVNCGFGTYGWRRTGSGCGSRARAWRWAGPADAGQNRRGSLAVGGWFTDFAGSGSWECFGP